MSTKENLLKAKLLKDDEFYTQITDIEKELKHYKHQFKDKVVYCNCDDPRVSNFFKYFYDNFDNLGLKKLIASCYKNQDRDLFSTHDNERACYVEYTGNEDIKIKTLIGDGDFRSKESIDLLKQADVVVSNPPFSLFREYIAQLIEYDKKFLIIGNINAITYNEIFKPIRDKKIWLGGGDSVDFIRPDGSKKAVQIRWFTNLDHPKRHEDIILYETYTPEKYPRYINYDAINVDKTQDIPMDYDGEMGVPITYIDKHNPDQFKITGLGTSRDFFTPNMDFINPIMVSNNRESDGGKINIVLVLNVKEKPVNKTYYTADNVDGYLIAPYARLLIKRK